jgi:ADP-heptose:LPS heptosyltransferase
VTEYYGVDLSEVAVAYSKSNTWDERFSFHEVDLTKQTPSLYENIVSLETIEHVPNPYQFMELLIEKMAPDGQLLISIPHEISCGSHLNPYHFSNWNYKRLINFLEQYFEEITVFPQERGTLEAGTFEASEIFNRTPNEDHDEFFIVILRRPCKKKRPNIILRRSKALGDVIWATPILRELRHYYPCHNVLVSTERTDVFIHNTDADLVFNLQYKFLPDDLLVNLDETREMFRELHPLHAYAKASGIPLTLTQPTLYLTSNEFRLCAAHVLHHFKNLDTERIIAVHMTATSLDRTWSKKYWQQLISNLLQQDKKLGIVILGYGQDFSAADTGFSTNRRVLCLVRQLSLMRTAAVLSLCDLLITPNSEVLHIAAAVSVSYLGLFNTADHTACLPFTAGSRAIRADLECRGCLQNIAYTEAPPCPSGHPDCIERIFPEEVQAMTIRMLEAVTPGGWKTRCRMAIPNKQ